MDFASTVTEVSEGVFSLEDVGKAHERLASGQALGKVVIKLQ